ncbi:hypothetical protein FQN60_007522 [Etheostoma spectabile]|uniref:Uncharacterized protein n=1 Tax=Etheostoma spectabile TaxID=54343 RepID=A0A5J5CYG6_9PERO|nr:hypothetical protein FQN60_007522 [Etheostoma spectabile]
MAATLLGEEPRLGSAPLAMLAATCSRIGEPSPSYSPALSDGAQGHAKGFHPWKRGAPGTSSLGACFASPGVPSGTSRSNGVSLTEASSAFSVTTANSPFGNDFSMYQSSVPSDNGVPDAAHAQRSVFLTKFPSSVEGITGIYPRMHTHPYESWFKPVGDVNNGSTAWWDMGTSWVDTQSPAGLPSHLNGYNTDYNSAFCPGASQHLLPATQHLFDGFRPPAPTHYTEPTTTGAPALTGTPVVSLPASSRSSSRRYSGRATCDCPNCREAESLVLPGVTEGHLGNLDVHLQGTVRWTIPPVAPSGDKCLFCSSRRDTATTTNPHSTGYHGDLAPAAPGRSGRKPEENVPSGGAVGVTQAIVWRNNPCQPAVQGKVRWLVGHQEQQALGLWSPTHRPLKDRSRGSSSSCEPDFPAIQTWQTAACSIASSPPSGETGLSTNEPKPSQRSEECSVIRRDSATPTVFNWTTENMQRQVDT